jgi:CDP-glucose 4,6-dehydratase
LEPLAGYILLAENLYDRAVEFPGPWNFGPTHENIQTVEQVVRLAAKEWGDSVNLETNGEQHIHHEANQLQLNSNKAKSLLGWQPCLNPAQAIKQTIQWYKEYCENNLVVTDLTSNQISAPRL